MFKRYKSISKKLHSSLSTIEAVQFTNENKNQIFNSLTGNYYADFENNQPILKITTLHRETAIVRLGDWIIKEEEIGCYYPIKDNIFKKKYIELDE